MTDSVNRISVISSLVGDGSGLADKREKSKRRHRDDQHDMVVISAEARNLCASGESDDVAEDDADCADEHNGECK